MANRIKVPVFFEPTSVPKAIAAAEEGVMNYVTFTSPNEKVGLFCRSLLTLLGLF
jgi:hypothetical protein